MTVTADVPSCHYGAAAWSVRPRPVDRIRVRPTRRRPRPGAAARLRHRRPRHQVGVAVTQDADGGLRSRSPATPRRPRRRHRADVAHPLGRRRRHRLGRARPHRPAHRPAPGSPAGVAPAAVPLRLRGAALVGALGAPAAPADGRGAPPALAASRSGGPGRRRAGAGVPRRPPSWSRSPTSTCCPRSSCAGCAASPPRRSTAGSTPRRCGRCRSTRPRPGCASSTASARSTPSW